jgi:hypothetical protein
MRELTWEALAAGAVGLPLEEVREWAEDIITEEQARVRNQFRLEGGVAGHVVFAGSQMKWGRDQFESLLDAKLAQLRLSFIEKWEEANAE